LKSGAGPEKIDRDISSLTKQELTEIISNESPELIELLAEFKEKLAEVKNNLHPVLERQASLLDLLILLLLLRFLKPIVLFCVLSFFLLWISQGPERRAPDVEGHQLPGNEIP